MCVCVWGGVAIWPLLHSHAHTETTGLERRITLARLPESRLRLCRVKPDRHTVLLRDEAGDFAPSSSR